MSQSRPRATVSDADSSEAIVGETFRNLVRQFSQELCFYRELIQNALDAGSNRIDIDVEHDGARKLAIVSVVDYGEGMDRTIIDTQLTRLFSSSKEDDFTKIGKFGIGFVSVFSVKPEAVVVDTGRGGESWRVLFGPDGRFERIVLESPVEGTRVQLYVPMEAREVPAFERRSKETIAYWCRHTSAEIHFKGTLVNEPFDLPGRIRVRWEESGTEVVAALSADEEPFFGFYNQGITLLEGRRAYIPGVSFKIKSRYLEHTLTRDDVRQDENFKKAMQILEKGVAQQLVPEMLKALAGAVSSPQEMESLWTLSARRLEKAWDGAARSAPMLPLLAAPPSSPDGLKEVAQKTRAFLEGLGWASPDVDLLWEVELTPLAVALGARGVPVLGVPGSVRLPDSVTSFLSTRGLKLRRASDVVCRVQRIAPTEAPGRLGIFVRAALDLLERCGLHVASLEMVQLQAGDETPPFIVQAEPGDLALLSRRSLLGENCLPATWPFNLFGAVHGLFNVENPLVEEVAALPEEATEVAAYLLAKVACLAEGLHPTMDARLLEHALTRRPASEVPHGA